MPRKSLPPSERLLSVNDVAAFWGTHPATVRRAIAAGKLRAYRLPSGHLRIDARDAEYALNVVVPETVSA